MFERFRITLAISFLMLVALSSEQAFSQLLVPYTSQEQITAATDVAKDSLGPGVELIGIATTGEIDLSPVGLSGTVSGFDEENGESSVWGYQFASSNGEEEVGVVIIKFPFGSPFVRTEDGNIYNVNQVELDLSGEYSASNRFAAQLRMTPAFEKFRSDYPDAVAEAVVLAWNPDDADDLLPSGFPRTLPLWSIYFNTGSWGSGDSTLICFMATGTGETICYRSSQASSVASTASGESLAVSLSTNVFVRGVTQEIEVGVSLSAMHIKDIALYRGDGARIIDLNDQLSTLSTGDSATLSLRLEDLEGGRYYLHATDGVNGVTRAIVIQ